MRKFACFFFPCILVALFFEVSTLTLVSFSRCARAGSVDDVKTIDVVDVGFAEWRHKVEFKCDYTYREGIVSSKEKALPMLIADCEKITLEIHGKFIKSERKTLVSQLVDIDVYTPAQSQDYVAVINERLEAHYLSDNQSHSLSDLFVFERKKEHIELPYPIVVQTPGFYPLSPTGAFVMTSERQIIEMLRNQGVEVQTEIKALDNGNVRLMLNMNEPSGNLVEVHTVFSTSNIYPLPVEYHSKTKYTTGKEYHNVVIVRDFVVCKNGISVPKEIVSYTGTLNDWHGAEYVGKWRIKEWKSDNIGNGDEINDQDFLIPLSEKTSIGGLSLALSRSLKGNTPKFFDIDSYTLYDLYESTAVAEQPISKPHSLARTVLIIILTVLIVITLFAMFVKKRYSTQ
jgi:hypothetical protein